MIDLTSKRFTIFGLQGEGKTELAKAILRVAPKHIVFDVLGEYAGFTRYKANPFAGLEDQLAAVVDKLVVGKGLDLVLVDEAHEVCPPKPHPLPDPVRRLLAFQRHKEAGYGMALGFVAQRPVMINTDIVELCHYTFLFNLKGKNDMAYLDAYSDGLGDLVASLEPFNYVVVDQRRNYWKEDPLEL